MTNPYESPREPETKSRPSTTWLRVFLGSLFVTVGFPILAEGIFGVFNDAPIMGPSMFFSGLLIVFAGWYCFKR